MNAGLTVQQLCDAKGFRPKQLAQFGVHDGTHNGRPGVLIPYMNTDGTTGPVKARVRLEEPGRFWWPKGKPTMPYGLDRLAGLSADVAIVVVEGETDCWTLWLNGFAALGIPGASTWKAEYAALLAGRSVYVWQEPGASGEKFVAAITRDLPDARVIRGTPNA